MPLTLPNIAASAPWLLNPSDSFDKGWKQYDDIVQQQNERARLKLAEDAAQRQQAQLEMQRAEEGRRAKEAADIYAWQDTFNRKFQEKSAIYENPRDAYEEAMWETVTMMPDKLASQFTGGVSKEELARELAQIRLEGTMAGVGQRDVASQRTAEVQQDRNTVALEKVITQLNAIERQREADRLSREKIAAGVSETRKATAAAAQKGWMSYEKRKALLDQILTNTKLTPDQKKAEILKLYPEEGATEEVVEPPPQSSVTPQSVGPGLWSRINSFLETGLAKTLAPPKTAAAPAVPEIPQYEPEPGVEQMPTVPAGPSEERLRSLTEGLKKAAADAQALSNALKAPVKAEGIVTISTDEEYEKLASGTVFIGPDGKKRRKP